jgi:hypothetical protein
MEHIKFLVQNLWVLFNLISKLSFTFQTGTLRSLQLLLLCLQFNVHFALLSSCYEYFLLYKLNISMISLLFSYIGITAQNSLSCIK